MIAVMMVIVEMNTGLSQLIIVIIIGVALNVLMMKHQFDLAALLHHPHDMFSMQKHCQRQHRSLLQRRQERDPAKSGDQEAKTLRARKH